MTTEKAAPTEGSSSQQPAVSTTESSSSKRPPPSKKRKTAASKKKKSSKKSSASSTSTNAVVTAPTTTTATPPPPAPPTHILCVDNGGDTLKFGWSNTINNTDSSSPSPSTPTPRHMPNVTARLPQQWTVLAGDQLTNQIQNPNQLIFVTRSTERGVIVNLGNQVQVWKRMLDVLNVAVVPSPHSEAAQALGWKANKEDSNKKKQKKKTMISPATCAVLLGLPPHCPRCILDQILWVWFEDFGFSHVGLCVSPLCAAAAAAAAAIRRGEEGQQHPDFETCCVVDLGWSATHIVPTFQGRVLKNDKESDKNKDNNDASTTTSIRRMPLAGRHLINMWKYFTSYRQWNLMDQEWILRDVLHQTGYVSSKFKEEMKIASQVPAGKRPYDLEYLLPDYQNTFQGRVQLPVALQQQQQQSAEDDAALDEDEDDADVTEKEMEEAEEKANDDGGDDDDDDDDGEQENNNSDEEEESPEVIRQRLLKQRAQEERRRRELELEQQILKVSVERFAVPETLFRPSDAGLPSEWAGLPAAIVQSIEACPKELQPALYQSIHLVGGLSQLPGLKERLSQELRALAPCAFETVITASESPVDQAWLGMCMLSKEQNFEKWSISRQEWESMSKRGVWKRLTQSGQLV